MVEFQQHRGVVELWQHREISPRVTLFPVVGLDSYWYCPSSFNLVLIIAYESFTLKDPPNGLFKILSLGLLSIGN